MTHCSKEQENERLAFCGVISIERAVKAQGLLGEKFTTSKERAVYFYGDTCHDI